MAERVFALAVAAGDGELVLSWDAPRECPTQAEVVTRVHERIGVRPHAGVVASAVVSARGAKWRLELEIAAAEGTVQRAIDGGSCEALADAAALVLAMAAAASPPVDPAPPEPTPVEPPIAATPMSPQRLLDLRAEVHEAVASRSDYVDPTLPERDENIPGARFATAGGLDLAGVPGLGGTLAFELGLHWTRTRLVVHLVHAIERRTADAHTSAAHRMTAAGLGLCRVLPLTGRLEHGLELGVCARTELGRARTRGLRGTDLAARSSLWSAVILGGTAAWWVAEHWSVGVSVDAVVPLRRHRIRIGDAAVGLVGVVGLRALAGVAVRLP